jgi:catechol 2,3-dioxygenase-like lactoylglutathione lyase family enzyme
MNFKYICTRLNVQNYTVCKLFYQDVLGLKVSSVNDVEEYTEFDAGATKITILNRSRLKDYIDLIETATYDRHDAKIILTFAVPDLDKAIAQLKAKGIPLFSSPWQFLDDGLAEGGGSVPVFAIQTAISSNSNKSSAKFRSSSF